MKTQKKNGFSLPELLVVIAVLAIVAGVGVVGYGNFKQSVNEQKLKNEVGILNSALAAYLSFGGDLEKADTADAAIEKLRSVAASDTAKRIPGLSSSLIDPRLTLIYQSKEEAQSDSPRVYWNNAKKRFDFARSGETGGIKSIFIDNDADEPEATEDDRKFTVLYAANDSWVWDYNETMPSSVSGPTIVNTVDDSTLTDGALPGGDPGGSDSGDSTSPPSGGGSKPPLPSDLGTDGSEDEDDSPEPVKLDAPVFSKPGGDYSVNEFNMMVSLTNPNPSGSSSLFYQLDYGNWNSIPSGSSVEVAADQVLTAQVIASTQDWIDSNTVSNSYSAEPEQLEPPIINLSDSSFGVFDRRVIAVVLEDANTDPDIPSQLQYKINDGPWYDYDQEAYLLLDRIDFENGASILARATSTDSNYLTSEVSFDSIGSEALTIEGLSNGEFANPDSNKFLNWGMVTNINYNNSSDEYFEWGRITDNRGNYYDTFSKSWMEYTAAGNGTFDLGERFHIGDLDYFNGKYVADTGADSVDLGIDLAMNISGQVVNTEFTYEFDLINSVNDDLDLYGWNSADYVQIDRPNSKTTFEVNGLTFELVLEFGDTTANGFSTFDEFHIREEHSASSNLYATIFDRTVSQGTVNGSGQQIEVAALAAPVDPNPSPDPGGDGSGFWSRLASWLSSFRD